MSTLAALALNAHEFRIPADAFLSHFSAFLVPVAPRQLEHFAVLYRITRPYDLFPKPTKYPILVIVLVKQYLIGP